MPTIAKVLYTDKYGTEHILNWPGKRIVCPKCKGHGTHLNPSIGEYGYSREEFEEAFPFPEDKEQYFNRGGIYDVTCFRCKGERVITVVDRARLTPAQRKLYDKMERNAAILERERRDEEKWGW